MKVKSISMLVVILTTAICIRTQAQNSSGAGPAAPATPTPSEQPAKPAKPAGDTTKAKRDWYPFHGEVTAIDKESMTISLKRQEGARVLHMDSSSQLARADKSLALADVKVGEYAQGKLRRNEQGKEVIASATFTTEAPAARGDKKEKTTKKASQ